MTIFANVLGFCHSLG